MAASGIVKLGSRRQALWPEDGHERGAAEPPMRILVLGAGVIGSVYAGKLLQAVHHVVLPPMGRN
jgi:hypothetical protein